MSFQYDQYLTQHRSNVKRGFDWIAENLPELLVDGFDYGWQIEFAHDKSKDEQDEIFGWYDEHCKYMKLHPKTRKTIEDILEKMKTKLDEIKEKK